MIAFADTSALYALLANDDYMHVRAKAIFESFSKQETTLVTSSYVLVETMALIQRRLGMAAVIDFHQHIQPLLEIIWIDADWHSRAIQRLLTIQRQKVSFVDCLSFVLMETKGIGLSFSFDSHFEEQGFAQVAYDAP